jgi:hypothetical protein
MNGWNSVTVLVFVSVRSVAMLVGREEEPAAESGRAWLTGDFSLRHMVAELVALGGYAFAAAFGGGALGGA